MKKVTAFVGAGRKGHTYQAVRKFLERLETLGDVETELVRLGDYRIETCRGCKVCFEKGEELCPLKDDRDVLIDKMTASDGLVFASPNYSFQVSGMMKVFLDRLGYAFHRPQFHGKTYTSIVVQGIHGGRKLVKYLDFVGYGLGFNVVKGTFSTAFVPMTDKERLKRDKALAKQARRFHERLFKEAYPVPGLLGLAIFRMARSGMGAELDERSRDWRYYTEKGWFDSDYWYPTRLGLMKRAAGSLFDVLFTRIYSAKAAKRGARALGESL
ncbi:MAG: flavodoxin family protein [Actinobacteria bacterium]|nr:MAG: flavodoxin family protein [Actinomycetota bacterium]